MPWRANLVDASFRGVGFQVDETEAPIAGRRVAVHEYPGRDEPFVEDLGRRTKKWSIEAFVVGDDYADVRDRLIEACDMPGAGELIHPYLGSLQVACTGCGLTERTREGRMARLSLEFVEAGANQYPTSRGEHGGQRDLVCKQLRAGVYFPVPRNLWLVMAFASFVADAAIAVVQAAADEIGGPLAPELRRNAPALVYSVRQLAVDMDAAIGVLADIDKLEDLAFNALDSYPAVVGTTLNRNQERNNQAALINFVRGLATVRFAARVGIEEYRDREQAEGAPRLVYRGAGRARGRCEHPRLPIAAEFAGRRGRARARGAAAPAAGDRGDAGQRAAVACDRI